MFTRFVMKLTIFFTTSLIIFLCSCDMNKTKSSLSSNSLTDSMILVQMVNKREEAMKKKDIASVMTQFSNDATFINSDGFFCGDKNEIEKFHNSLTHLDSIGYYYKAGNVLVRILNRETALVYYPWRMDWFKVTNPYDTLYKEVGLMTLTAAKRNDHWFWVAITNQHTKEYFNDLTKHKPKKQ